MPLGLAIFLKICIDFKGSNSGPGTVNTASGFYGLSHIHVHFFKVRTAQEHGDMFK